MVAIARKRRGVIPSRLMGRLAMAGAVVAGVMLLVFSVTNVANAIDERGAISQQQPPSGTNQQPPAASTAVSYQTPLAYGTKGGKGKTAQLVQQALEEGFRHVVTGGHHGKHNESGVGEGWKASQIPRNELFLQTLFVPFSEKHADFARQPTDPEVLPAGIEDQVRLSVETSLKNLQTDYLDALLFNNFRKSPWDMEEIKKAWTVMEDYVDKGVIRHLGLTSVHQVDWFEQFWNATRIKPRIVQNRFHSNRKYDVPMQETFRKHKVWVQRFWLLNGSSKNGSNNQDTAAEKGVTKQQLMLAFVMSQAETCLVGTKSLQHMRDDLDTARCYPSLFETKQSRRDYAAKLGMAQPEDQPLPGTEGVHYANPESPNCRAPPDAQATK